MIDTYTSNVTLKPWAEDEHMLQTAHIINIVNVFDKSWSTAQVLCHYINLYVTVSVLDLLALALPDSLRGWAGWL